MEAAKVIKHYGRPMEALDHAGRKIERKDKIFLRSHRMWYYTMDMDNHFIYESRDYGSSVMCTCGATAVVVNYEVYKEYSSNKGPMLVCSFYMEHRKHADGSS